MPHALIRLEMLCWTSATLALVAPSSRLDRANSCQSLPARPQGARIVHRGAPVARGHLPEEWRRGATAQLQVGETLTVAAPAGVALRWPCRELVGELGTVSAIHLAGPAWAVRVCRPLLRASYGGAPVVLRGDSDDAGPAQGDDDTAFCDVRFTRGQLWRGALCRASRMWATVARRLPLMLRVLLMGVRAWAARLALVQLTPAYPPPLALRMLPRLPWRLQRLAARTYVHAQLPATRLDTGTTAAGASSSSSPMLGVQTVPLLSADECAAVVREAEAWGARNGWTTDRHVSFPTTDIPLRHLPELQQLWNESLFPRVEAAQRAALGLGLGRDGAAEAEAEAEAERITPLDVFVVKYSAAGQRELAVHRDNGLLTFSLLLNPHTDFEGGGTYFERRGRVYRPSQGVGVLHSALARHAGYPISGGERYVLVGFCGLESPRLPAGYDAWRFGNPAWYVSSAVVGDQQILERVWPGRSSGSVAIAPATASAAAADDDDDDDVPSIYDDDVYDDDDDVPTIYDGVDDDDDAEVPPEATQEDTEAAAEAAAVGEAAASRGEKPWYAQQHAAAIRAARGGDTSGGGGLVLLEERRVRGGLRLEYWRAADGDLVGLLVRPSAEAGGGEVEVVGSLLYREGGVDPSLRAALRYALPPRFAWAAHARAVVGLARRQRIAGLLYVYVAPVARGGPGGAALVRGAHRVLRRRLGISHALTLADDTGSGKLRTWYEALGFVDATRSMDPAMLTGYGEASAVMLARTG